MSDARVHKRVRSITSSSADSSDPHSKKRNRVHDEAQLKRRRSVSPEPPLKKKADTEATSQLIHYNENLIRPPVIPLDPSQRLDLLKRRQRWRQSNYYYVKNYRVNSIRPTIIAAKPPSTTYVDMATQTDSVPVLKSQNSIVKKDAVGEAEKKLMSGVFSGALLYEHDDIDNRGSRARSPVRFPDDKKPEKNTLPLSQNTLSALITEKKKLVQAEVQPVVEDPKKVADKPLGPSAGFNFLSSKKTEEVKEDQDPQPSKKKSFSFGANITTDKIETSTPSLADKDKSKPSFSFGNNAPAAPENKEKPATNLFSFDSAVEKKNDTPKSSINLGSFKEDKAASSGFSFGTGSTEEKNDDKAASTGFSFGAKKDDNKPTTSNEFSFGAAKDGAKPAPPAFSFGAKTGEKKEEPPKSFSFGSNSPAPTSSSSSLFAPEKKDEPAKPTFGLESNSLTGGKREDAPKPSFTMPTASGTTSLFSKPEEKNNSSKPTFNFGSTTEKKDNAPKPAFSFGSGAEKKDDAPKPAFSFGSAAEKKDDVPKPAFSFGSGASTESKPASTFSFGAVKPLDSSKPSSLFGVSKDEKQEENEPKRKAPFSFGASTSDSTSTTDKPSFGFSAPSKLEEPAKPTFTFGAAKPADPTPAPTLSGAQKPTFNFGATQLPSTSSTPTTEKPSLFGASKPAEAKPISFNFGGSSAPQNPASVFGASNPSKNSTSAFAFGSTSTPAGPTAPFGQAPVNPPTSFNFGATTAPTFGAPNGNPTPAAGVNPSFSFGAPTTADPAKIFGQSVPAANTGTFGQPAAPQQSAFGGFNGFNNSPAPSGFGQQTPSFVGGSTPFGSNTPVAAPGTPSQPAQSRIPGRKIAQMRTRRR